MPAVSTDELARLTGGLLLALDTTGECCSAAVADGASGEVLAAREPRIGRGHAERLMAVVAEVLGEAGAEFSLIGRVAVAVGPGSFTGIRVGVSAARGFGLALGCPVVPVGTLEALAEPFLGGECEVLAVQDARRGELFVALYGAGREVRVPPRIATASTIDAVLGRSERSPLLLVGSGARIAHDALGPSACEIASEADVPSIGAVARIGARREPGEPVRPLYLRGADTRPQAPAGLRSGALLDAVSNGAGA